ncbi:MAG TPA: heme-binding protein [Solirubrobacterales bacterium]|nr:heme-binding protein [Solirubrobacterales bacterium]
MTDESAVNLTAGARYLELEVERQGLDEEARQVQVEVPEGVAPRGGGAALEAELGALGKLPGAWVGSGFNLIARPDKQHSRPFFLELNATTETLEFTPISGPIPNRGSRQDDISFLGLTYLQRISDAVHGGGLHIEPGIWINVPPTEAPHAPGSVVRMATVPHGNSLLAQGKAFTVKGPPKIDTISSTPIVVGSGKPVSDVGYLDPYLKAKLPPGVPKGSVADPNLFLKEGIKGKEITETETLVISTKPVGGVENIPFLVENADALSMNAIFWIETLKTAEGTLLQLQYTQTVLLRFDGIDWPHISVATLIKF